MVVLLLSPTSDRNLYDRLPSKNAIAELFLFFLFLSQLDEMDERSLRKALAAFLKAEGKQFSWNLSKIDGFTVPRKRSTVRLPKKRDRSHAYGVRPINPSPAVGKTSPGDLRQLRSPFGSVAPRRNFS